MNAIDVRSILKKFGDFTAVNGISFVVEKGEIFGLLGQQFKPVDDRVNESVGSGGAGVLGDVRPDLLEVLLGKSGQPIRHLRLLGASRTTARLDPLGELPTGGLVEGTSLALRPP